MTKRKKQITSVRNRKATASAKSGRPLWFWLAGGGVLLGLLVISLFFVGNMQPPALTSDIEGVVILPDQARGHQEGDIHTDDEVPAGGVHNSAWQNCGIYNEPIREENVVHSMEHGAVWIAYRPDLSDSQVETLRQLVRSERNRQAEPLIVLAPKPVLESPIMATAWRVQLELDSADDERLAAFVAKYQRGPLTPEPQANCVNGVGEPVS